MSYVIHWFRQDLRLKDNIALAQCCNSKEKVLFLYIHNPSDPYKEADAHNVWLHHALENLQKNLPLLIMQGSAKKCFKELIKKAKPKAVYYNEVYDEASRNDAQEARYYLEENKVLSYRYHGNLFCHPDTIQHEDGHYFDQFAPFWKRVNSVCEERPLYPKPKLNPYPYTAHTLELSDLNLIHSYHLEKTLPKFWKVNEESALLTLRSFIKTKLTHYRQNGKKPALDSTSKLGPYLTFGMLSPYQILYEVNKSSAPQKECEAFIRDIGMREFAQYLLYHQPEMHLKPMLDVFVDYHWTENQDYFQAWKKGQTGYPIVDAAMRQLLSMGWCHPTGRIIASSFLVKDLNIHWQEGERWFFKHLFDADIAANAYNWQRMMGCATDTQEHYKRFDPAIESAKYDSKGEYIRKWVPELANLPLKYLHTPWLAPKGKFEIGRDYPIRIIEHNKEAKKALKALHARALNKKRSAA